MSGRVASIAVITILGAGQMGPRALTPKFFFFSGRLPVRFSAAEVGADLGLMSQSGCMLPAELFKFALA